MEYKIKSKYLNRFKDRLSLNKELWYHLCLAYVDIMKSKIKRDEKYFQFCKDKILGKKTKFTTKGYKQEYLEYLDSVDWEKKRQRTFMFKGEECEICGSKKKLNIHHGTYENFKNEKDEDLFVFCNDCHKSYHEYIKGQKTTNELTKEYIMYSIDCMLDSLKAQS